ncbi:hypothetical protein QFC24_003611 [Naganishia onofrii]|uniref:Uncharacterized protein n=1 Tax=Naganishia onofrii TaxID=1851511 RepID=A0ACC2XIG9_9TREE|nr:hypothetical protein QFC24_003611 [Naganishia onofrii]
MVYDFADFQAAPTSGFNSSLSPAQAPKPAGNVFDFLDAAAPASKSATSPTPAYAPASTGFGALGASSSSYAAPAASSPVGQARPSNTMPQQTQAKPASSSSGLGGFDDLWNTSLSSVGGNKAPANGSGKKTIAEMEREKSKASLWGSSSAGGGSSSAQQKPSSSGFEDLLG